MVHIDNYMWFKSISSWTSCLLS